MKFRRRILLAVITTFVLITNFVLPANACTSIIVGKNASATGEVILGQNEDNGGRLVMPQYYVPRMKHAPGEYIILEPGSARIPQVEETWAFYWSETRSPGGSSFSDGYVNEWGVAIATDNCSPTREDNPDIKDGGIKHGVRRIVAERAKTAREGVEIIAELVETYGYNHAGRSYQIVDKNEGWMVHLVNGSHYVAKRVPDDEVAIIPNRYTIHEVDLNDTENYIASPDLITYAIERGWYTPAVEGDYSDFSFAKAYQSNYKDFDVRQWNAQRLITGREPEDGPLPFSVKPNRKIGIEDVKEVLRSHYVGTEYDQSDNYTISPYRTGVRVIDASTTQTSMIVQFREDPRFTVIWKTLGRTNTSPYVPWYLGAAQVPDGYGWIDPIVGFANKFYNPPADDFGYNPDRAWWAFQDLQSIVEPQYGRVIESIWKDIDKMEKQWANRQKGIENSAKAMLKNHPDKAMEHLAKYTNQQAQSAWDWAVKTYNKLANVEIDILADNLIRRGNGEVSVAILSNNKFDATKVDPQTVRFGPNHDNPYSRAAALNSEIVDINNDRRLDMVVTFSEYDVTRSAPSQIDCYYDLWLWGETLDGEIFVAKDCVNVLK